MATVMPHGPSDKRIRIALAQLAPGLGDKPANVAAAERAVGSASDRGADLVMFPELFLTGYFTRERTGQMAETIDGPSLSAIRECARRYGIMVLIGFAERDPASGLLYDSVCLIGRGGGTAGCYRKTHLFGEEARYFAAGGDIRPVDLGLWRAGLMVCFDLEFPEVSRALALGGASLLLVASANMTPYEAYQDVYVRARALENHCFCALVNRVGAEEDTVFCGRSAIVDPFGRELCRAAGGEEIVTADLDLSQTEEARAPVGYLARRRPSLYRALVHKNELQAC
jgi:predicted amidohydrolase